MAQQKKGKHLVAAELAGLPDIRDLDGFKIGLLGVQRIIWLCTWSI